MEWYWWMLILAGILLFFIGIGDASKQFNSRDKKGEHLYQRILQCSSKKEWLKLKEAVEEFCMEYPESSGWILALRKRLNETARKIIAEEYDK